MAFGLIDTSYIDWPSNVDAAYLRGLQTRSGLNFTELATALDNELTAVNTGADPVVAALSAPWTDTIVVAGGRTSSMKVTKKSEYTVPRPQQVERNAHSLAIDEVDIAIGFTEDGLMEISRPDFDANIQAMREALELAFRRDALIRLFSDAEVTVDPINPTTSTSPGFAGSGTGGNAFAATYPDGSALPGGYSHYYRDTNANRLAVIKTVRDRLAKWRPGPFDMVGSQAFIDAVVADTSTGNFVPAGSLLVRPGLTQATTALDPERYVGAYLGNIRVWQPLMDYTEDVGAIFKTFGDFAPNNPLVPRYDPLRGRNAYVRSRQLFPLAEAVALWKYARNVNNRVGAGLIKIAASGSYAMPTLTY